MTVYKSTFGFNSIIIKITPCFNQSQLYLILSIKFILTRDDEKGRALYDMPGASGIFIIFLPSDALINGSFQGFLTSLKVDTQE